MALPTNGRVVLETTAGDIEVGFRFFFQTGIYFCVHCV